MGVKTLAIAGWQRATSLETLHRVHVPFGLGLAAWGTIRDPSPAETHESRRENPVGTTWR